LQTVDEIWSGDVFLTFDGTVLGGSGFATAQGVVNSIGS
jgi:hypothetical protein